MTVLYGIPNCTTVKKARQWLDDNAVPYTFRNLKTDLPDAAHLEHWLDAVGTETLINRKGTTWRKLSETERAADSREAWIELMRQHPSVIKRPILEQAGHIETGFTPERYQTLFSR